MPEAKARGTRLASTQQPTSAGVAHLEVSHQAATSSGRHGVVFIGMKRSSVGEELYGSAASYVGCVEFMRAGSFFEGAAEERYVTCTYCETPLV